MDRAEIQQIKKKYRINYAGRTAWSVVVLAVVLFRFEGLIIALCAGHLAFSLAWILMVETEARVIFIENLRFFRIAMDAFLYTVVVYISGGTTSFCLLSYIIFVMMASLYTTNRFGIYAIVTCMLFYNIMNALIYGGYLPKVNFLAGGGLVDYPLNAGTVLFSNFVLLLVSVIMNMSAHSLYASLMKKTDELAVEHNKLRVRNEMIESELAMARSIQERIIPSQGPADYIHVMYRPMEQVGGDFLDFIQFTGSDRMGIFLSDVSGHGVPAAFITSMIKTILLQAGTRIYDPAGLLRYMNDVLYDQTGGNFVTAFYGIVDPAEKSIVYSNAGHPHPYVITPGGIGQIAGGKSSPLGIFLSDDFSPGLKPFRNERDGLPVGGKLLLYTDGLIEAVPQGREDQLFQDGPMAGILSELSVLPGEGFIRGLFEKLVEFRGSERFEDDICLICVET